MDVIILLVFVSLLLVSGAVLLLLYGMKQGDFDHGERLSLLPLTDERLTSTVPSTTVKADHRSDSEGSRRTKNSLEKQGKIDS